MSSDPDHDGPRVHERSGVDGAHLHQPLRRGAQAGDPRLRGGAVSEPQRAGRVRHRVARGPTAQRAHVAPAPADAARDQDRPPVDRGRPGVAALPHGARRQSVRPALRHRVDRHHESTRGEARLPAPPRAGRPGHLALRPGRARARHAHHSRPDVHAGRGHVVGPPRPLVGHAPGSQDRGGRRGAHPARAVPVQLVRGAVLGSRPALALRRARGGVLQLSHGRARAAGGAGARSRAGPSREPARTSGGTRAARSRRSPEATSSSRSTTASAARSRSSPTRPAGT